MDCFEESRKEQLSDFFVRRHAEATQELKHLTRMYYDVCWYNFEVNCRTWSYPWPRTIPGSSLCIHAYRVEPIWVNGRKRECGTFPVYWSGPAEDAPPLPPQIIQEEIILAAKLVDMYKEAITAPYDWAPGGRLYQKLLRDTSVPTKYNYRTSSDLSKDDRGRGNRSERRGRERQRE